LKKIKADEENGGFMFTPEDCQSLCSTVKGNVTVDGVLQLVPAVAFTLKDEGNKCNCLAAAGLNRHQEEGAFSGPVNCQEPIVSLKQQEEALHAMLDETPSVPMTEIEPCEKSPPESNFEEVEQKHPEWVKTCLTNATKIVVKEYNEYHMKFAKFLDRLAWAAGCGANLDSVFLPNVKEDPTEQVSSVFDAGNFAGCDWDREAELDENMWEIDQERARGWTGTSRITMEEQRKVQTSFPMPLWLNALRGYGDCFAMTAEGHQESEPRTEGMEMNNAFSTMMAPAQMDPLPPVDA
jgi:hypothetical protein